MLESGGSNLSDSLSMSTGLEYSIMCKDIL